MLSAFPNLCAQSATAPTASEDPVSIDQKWQKASSKYDANAPPSSRKWTTSIIRARSARTGNHSRSTKPPSGTRTRSSGSSFIGASYSVPAFGNEWYPRNMYREGSDEYKHHIATYGPQDKFGYKDFIPMFKAEHFDPAAWAELFKKAGAKYVVPVAEHHDGFAMYDSGLSDWTVAKMGPHRDIIGELAKAVRAEGLHFGAVVASRGAQFLSWAWAARFRLT